MGQGGKCRLHTLAAWPGSWPWAAVRDLGPGEESLSVLPGMEAPGEVNFLIPVGALCVGMFL